MAGPPDALLLDIEGTTTPIRFVHDVLFPFARERLAVFLSSHASDPDVSRDVLALRAEHARDQVRDAALPTWNGSSPDSTIASAAAYACVLIDEDRKSTPLKSLQGRIWEEGYRSGALQSPVYDDVPPAFKRWREARRRIAIFSSGSVLAQKLLFAHTTRGDLTPWIGAHFDTTTGPKRDPASYSTIAVELGVPPERVLFVSDTRAEVEAAVGAGMGARLCVREGPFDERMSPPAVRTFDALP